MSDDDDASALSHIASKMPTPPPRPSSIASSARSSRRSSIASSFHRQSKHASFGIDGELDETPPTPSISSRYTSVTLFDEMGEMPSHILDQSSSSSTVVPQVERSTSITMPRLGRIKSSSSGISLSGKRRSSRALKERDRESPGPLIAARPPNVSSQPATIESTAPGTVTPPLSGTKTSTRSNFIAGKGRLDVENLQVAVTNFFLDLGKASFMLLSLIIWPVMLEIVDSVAQHSSKPATEIILTPSTVVADPSAIRSLQKTFAERFKYIICTSFLLTSSLSISSYDQKTPPFLSPRVKKQSESIQSKPLSTAEPRLVRAGSSDPQRIRSSLHLNTAGVFFFEATIVAILILLPFASNWQMWIRSAICLVSLGWGVIATFGIDDASELSFETSYRPFGSYKLCNFDVSNSKNDGDPIGKASRVKEAMCEQISALIKACKGFDIECNKAIAAVQEVELISRGFKLSHPLAPISRIEANNPIMSPPRLRNGSWQGNTAPGMSSTRLSRSSSGGASASSNWKHHGSRPQSVLFNNESISPTNNGRSSPQEMEVESIRLASLRKGLNVSFENAKVALDQAMEGLVPLVDKTELKLLEEMYDVHRPQEVSSVLPTMDRSLAPASGTRSLTEKRSSWVPLARLKLEEEVGSPISNDEGDRPATPQQRFSLLLENSSNTSSTRKRDSGVSETWSVASPSRETHSIRGGSRLGYVSDKTSVNSSAPNQTAESKRLSYISANSTATSPLHGKPFLMQQTTPAIVPLASHRKRASLLHSGLLDDVKPQNVIVSGTNAHSKTDAYLISSLKASFEKVHSLRKKVLCHFLALDFALEGAFDLDSSAAASATTYWATVSQLMRQLTKTMQRLTVDCTEQVDREVAVGQQSSGSTSLLSPADAIEQSSQDFTGVEDQIAAMGLSLRSIQVKMLICAKDLKVKSSPSLHGPSMSLPSEDSSSSLGTTQYEKSEKIFETIREDLLTLSAEWENALKIIRCQSTNAVGETTSSTINSTRLDSPQEAEEDALRQWVQARRGEEETSDSEDEREASRIIESGLLQWTGLDSKEDKWRKNGNLSELLIKTATPDHLPPPGLEKVYESSDGQAEAKKQKSVLSRPERIRLAKLDRAEAQEKPLNTSELEAPSKIMEELQAVMKNRKSVRGGNESEVKAELHSSLIPSQADIPQSTPPASTDEKQAAFAF